MSFDPAARQAGAGDAWLQAVSEQLSRDEYSAAPDDDGLQAPNRAQNLRTRFRETGIEVAPRRGEAASAWSLGWETARFGRLGAMEETAAAVPEADGSRITYRRAGIDEWYDNGTEGIEQGFTVHAPPPGEGPLWVTGRLTGPLRAELSADGSAVDLFDETGTAVLRYAELHVWDAHGSELPSSLQLSGQEIALLVEDEGAAYPLTIDPLIAVPNWFVDGDQATAQFGYTVATAGDVNGDGYMDVIVGAPGYDDPGTMDWGRVYVFHGSALGLSPTPAWTLLGDQAGAGFGHSVATAGDVNGDGYSDVIIGSWLHDNGEFDEGAAYVYHGSSTGLSLTPAWSAESNQFGARFGVSVAAAGDVNGDGYTDVIVGADLYTNGEAAEGRAYVYHGSASGLSTTPAWTVEPNSPGAHFGNAVATAGDVNGDGYFDVIVGASLAAGGQGQAFVYHGSASGLSTTSSWSGTGGQPGAGYGTSVAAAGDVNGDGFADVIVGSPSEVAFTNGGRAFVYNGSPIGLSFSPGWTGGAGFSGDRYGSSVASAGDMNADGYADVIVGCDDQISAGQAVVYHGSAIGPSTTEDWSVPGYHLDDRFGSSVAAAGDVNGDGFSDVIVGAHSYDTVFSDGGRAVVFHGGSPGVAATAGWFATSDQDTSYFGQSVASAGDVNGDGYADVIVGAAQYANGEFNEGHAFVFHGSASGPSATPDWTVEGNQAGVLLGQHVASAGDVNGDGFSDVLVTSYANNGTVAVYHGSATGLSTTANWVHKGGIFGTPSTAASAGDVNGDGYSDLIVGHSSDSHPETNEGRAFVFLGSATGLATTAAWSAESDQAFAYFGFSVATAGDVNGDGYSDVIVGSDEYDNGESNEGRAWVFLGSASGLAPTAAWTAESNQLYAQFGWSVGTAGDVNGDGYSDVVVGSLSYDAGTTNEGAAFIYHGSAAGLSPTHAWMVTGSVQGDGLGTSVAPAGDVNGDGYSDVVVGSPDYNAPHAFVYHGSPSGLSVAPAWFGAANQAGSSYGFSVAGAGDVNGDGFSDVLIGAYTYSAVLPGDGRAFLYYGNGFPGGGPSRPLGPRQLRTDGTTPIAKLGASDSDTEFRIVVNLPSAYGRTGLRLEYEVKPFGTSFDGVGTVISNAVDIGNSGQLGVNHLVSGLASDTQYHWRVRTWYDTARSLFQIHGPWFHQGPNGANEADFRTAGGGGVVSVTQELGPRTGARFELLAGGANPARGGAQVLLVLPERAHVEADVIDVAGRKVAVLARPELFDPGSHPLAWDGRTESGAPAATGVYFVRVRAGNEVRVRKAVLLR